MSFARPSFIDATATGADPAGSAAAAQAAAEATAAAALASHVAAADPHTGYQRESEKGAANGYPALNGSQKVTEDPANATSTATASKIPIADSNAALDTWVHGGAAIFGDGSDTDATISTTVTLTRDMFYNNLTVSGSGILQTAGYRIHVKGLLTVDSGGVISDDGPSATGATQGAGLGARGTMNTDSGSGGAGRNTTGLGNGGAAGSAQVANNTATPNGGQGGNASGGNNGGGGGNPTIRSATGGSLRNLLFAISGHCQGGNGVFQPCGGGGGGGGGGANVGTGTATSGGGGAGGGSVVIVARRFSNAGTIRANGGNGGNASVTGDGVAGGGGGGGGGFVLVTVGKLIAQGTIQANGGLGGNGAGSGATNGTPGSTGYTQVLAMAA